MKFAQQFFKRFAARPTPRAPAVAPAPLMLALEPRIVYEASVAAVPVAHHPEASHHHGDYGQRTQSPTVPGEGVTPGRAAWYRESEVNNRTQRAVTATTMTERAQPEKQVVFVDPNVPDYQELISGLTPGTRYVILNPNTDGLEQIAQYLERHPGVQAIDLISHGSDAEIQVGSTLLDPADLNQYSAELAQIGAAMAPGGDFLIYACNVAEAADGQALVQQVAALSHLHVAASTGLVGAASLGGSWTLNYDVGDVTAPTMLTAATEQQYSYVLTQTVENYTNANDSGYDSGNTFQFTLDGITYTITGTSEIDNQVGQDSYLQALSDENGSDNALLFDAGGVFGVSSIKISMANGSAFNITSLDFDGVANTTVNFAADGNAPSVEVASDGNGVTQTVELSGNSNASIASQFEDVTSVTISGGNLVTTLGHLVYGPADIVTTTGSTVDYASDANPITIDSGVTVSDGSSATQVSGTVSISSGFKSGDTLSFSNTSSTLYGNITESYNAGTGVLTLTSASGTATNAQWADALDAVTFSSNSTTYGDRTISFSVYDGAESSAAATDTIDVISNQPTLTTTGSTVDYLGGASAATIDSGVTITDASSTTEASGTVSIGSGFESGDTLSYSNMDGITGSYNATTGVLTLTGTASKADWQAAFDSVKFSSTSTDYGDRTISFTVSNGVGTSSAATDTVDVYTDPALTTTGSTVDYVSGASAATIDSGVIITDASSTTEASGTVSISGGFESGDRLSFTTMDGITGSYNSTTGVLTLSGTASKADWQAAFDSVQFSSTSTDYGDRTISFAVSNGLGASSAATDTVNVFANPTLTTTGGTVDYLGGASAATIDSGVTITDASSTTEASGTVSISGGFESGDTLSYSNMDGITGSYNAATGVLTLIGTASKADWQAAFDSVKFSSTSTDYGDRTISFTVGNGVGTSSAATDTVDVTNPDPVVTTDSGSAAFVAGDNTTSTPVAVDSGLTVMDPESSTLVSATVSITGNFHSGEDVLSFTNNGSTMGDIVGSYNSTTGVLTLTASGGATLAQWQNALEAVTYTDAAITPNNATRTISFTVTDSDSNTSNTATRTVTVADTDQTPIVTTTSGTTNYVGGTTAVSVDGGATLSDRDNTTQASGTISITSGFHSGDTLSFTNTSSTLFGNIVASYNATTGVLTLTSTGATSSDTQWANAFDAVAFSASASATPGDRTISFVVNDGTENSVAATKTVDVLGPPTITTDSGSAAFVAGDNATSTPVAIDSGLTVTDGGASTLASATVAITGNFVSGEDVLAFANTNSIAFGNIEVSSYNSTTGVLSLTSSGATATTAQWQAALDAVTYIDTAVTPNNATRTISFTVTDSNSDVSNTATRTVTVTDTDQTPILTTTSGNTYYVPGASAAAVDGGVTVGDRDNTTQASGTVSIGSGFESGDALSFTNTSSTSFGNITASYNATTGVLTLTSSGQSATDAQWANAFNAVTFSAESNAALGSRTISFVVNDGTENSAAVTKTVDVVAQPVVTTSAGATSFVSGDNTASTPVAIDPGLNVTDLSSTTLASATISITGNFHSGEDVLIFTNDGSTMGNIAGSYDASTGVLTLTSNGATATLAQWRDALDAILYTDTAVTPSDATRTISFTVNDGTEPSPLATKRVTVTDTDQTPLVTGGGTTVAYTDTGSGGAPVTLDPVATISDRGNASLETATVSVSGGFVSGQDVLSFSSSAATGNITASYDASIGVLTLTSSGGTATLAQWAAALDSVSFSETGAGVAGARTVSVTVSDGVKTSQPISMTVDVEVAPNVPNAPKDLPAATSNVAPPAAPDMSTTPAQPAGDFVSNQPVVLDELDRAPTIGAAPTVPTITFTDSSEPHPGVSLDRTSVSAVPLNPVFDAFVPSPSLLSPIPVVVDVEAAPAQPFSLDLSSVLPTAGGLPLNAASDVTLRLADGRPLPPWLHYDAADGVLSGSLPPGAHDIRIVVQERDAAGDVTHNEIVLAPGIRHGAHHHAHPAPHAARNALTHLVERTTGQAPLPAGKPSLAQQFARARAALHVVRPTANAAAAPADAVSGHRA